MQARGAQLRVDGLTSLQLAELRSAVAAVGPEEVTQIDPPSLGGSRAGEPCLLAAVVTIAPAVIYAVALWLSTKKKVIARNFRYAKINADGSVEVFDLSESSYEEGKASSDAVRKLLEEKLGDDTTGEG